jgi:hypothetical protein
MDWFDNIWGLRRDPEPETAPMDGDIFVGLNKVQAELLFHAQNSLDDLRRIVAELCEEGDA